MRLQPGVNGVVETALYVADLERSTRFYQDLFGFPLIYTEGDRLRALSVADRQVLLLFRAGGSRRATETPNGTIPPHDGHGTLHVAFAVTKEEMELWRGWLRDRGIGIESEVNCGGLSLYFRDPDGHLLELISPGCWPIY